MRARNTYFFCGLVLLLLMCALFLAGGYYQKRQVIQMDARYFTVISGSYERVVFSIPTLIAYSVICAAMGAITGLIALPTLLKRALAYVVMAGVLLHLLGQWVFHNYISVDYAHIDRARWILFWGYVCLAVPVLLHLAGLAWGSIRRRLWKKPVQAGGKPEGNMRSAKLYALGGLLLIFWVLMRSFGGVFPWQEGRAEGLRMISTGLYVWPVGTALGAGALFLSALQAQVAWSERIRITGAIAYFASTVFFLLALHQDMVADRIWHHAMSWPTAAGLGVLLAALALNLIGLARHREPPAQPASAVDGD